MDFKLVSSYRPTGDQPEAIDALSRGIENGVPYQTLLGVTGSGKTEIYIRWIERLTQDSGQVLLLVPEIGLVQTLAARLAARLGERIAVHHSALADGARLEQWLAVRAGDAQVLVGTRSAVFSPCAALRGIIIDEEHDAAYKQQDGFRYHARDLALKRAQQAGIPILLGSATPSLESYHQVWRGHWQHLRLTARAATTTPPAIHLENMDGAAASGGMSHELIRAMRRTLAACWHGIWLDRRQQSLYGHSYGGLFALYHLYTRASMQRYYLASPSLWWENRRIDDFADRLTAPRDSLAVRISVGSLEQAAAGDAKRRSRAMVENARALAGQLQQNQRDTTFTLLDGDNHGSAAFSALTRLLQDLRDTAPAK